MLSLAAPATQAGSILTMEFVSGPDNSSANTGASAQVTFEFFGEIESDLLEITISNTTSADIGASLTNIGFELPTFLDDPVFAPGGKAPFSRTLGYDFDITPESLNAEGGYDVTVSNKSDFYAGKPEDAPQVGESETIQLLLENTGMSAAELADSFLDLYEESETPWAVAYFQDVGTGSVSDFVTATSVTGTPVSEPATQLLLGIGAAALCTRRRRRVFEPRGTSFHHATA